MFDCGEGTQHQLLHTAFNPGKLDKILSVTFMAIILWFTRLAVQSFYVRHYPTLTINGPQGIRQFVETALRISGHGPIIRWKLSKLALAKSSMMAWRK